MPALRNLELMEVRAYGRMPSCLLLWADLRRIFQALRTFLASH